MLVPDWEIWDWWKWYIFTLSHHSYVILVCVLFLLLFFILVYYTTDNVVQLIQKSPHVLRLEITPKQYDTLQLVRCAYVIINTQNYNLNINSLQSLFTALNENMQFPLLFTFASIINLRISNILLLNMFKRALRTYIPTNTYV